MGKSKKRIQVLRALGVLAVLSWCLVSLRPVTSSSFPHAESLAVSTATREGRLAVFDDAWSRINERYYDRSFHGLDWDEQRLAFRAQVAEADSSQELYAILRRMIATLNDPHTRVFAPDEKFDWWRPRFVSTGIALAEVNGLPTVVQVERDSVPQRAGVRVGDVIDRIDGEAASIVVMKRLEELTTPVSASARLRVFAKLLNGPVGTALQVGWKTKDGKLKSAVFKRRWEERELSVRSHREQRQYAVIEIDAFTKPIATAFAKGLKEKLNGARGIIVDLRSNGGGDAEAMTDIASNFMAPGVDLGQFTDRFGVSFTIGTHSRSLFSPELISQIKLPLVVLTSERTSSAAEIFVAALKSTRRATIIGTATCGCVLAVRTRHLLPDGGLLDVSELDYETGAGQRLEGNGIDPDEIVTVERGDLYAGRDRAMELAINKLAQLHSTHH